MPYCTTNGIRLHYQIQGQGEPLLLIHGLGSCGEDWQEQVAFFAARYRVITVDCRGHGKSDKPESDYSIPLFASDITQLLDQLQITKLHLVGFSMGGMVSFQLAIDQPERFKSLVVINSAPSAPYSRLLIKLVYWQRLMTIHLFGMKALARRIAKQIFPEPEQKTLFNTLVNRIKSNPKQAYIRTLKAILGWDVSHQLSKLSMPVLVVSADQDYTPVSAKQAYVSAIPAGNLVVIPNSRHATPSDQPEKLNVEVSEFLTSLAHT